MSDYVLIKLTRVHRATQQWSRVEEFFYPKCGTTDQRVKNFPKERILAHGDEIYSIDPRDLCGNCFPFMRKFRISVSANQGLVSL